jgi:Protein of unknown function (DUF3995)
VDAVVLRRISWAVVLAVAWCSVFAAVHVFWALGGSVGLASSAGTELAARRPAVFVLAGLWGVAGLLLAGAAVIFLAATVQLSRPLRRISAWVIGVTGAVLALRGAGAEVILIANAGVRSALGPLETRWSLILWNPWFVLGGIVLIGAAVHIAQRAGIGARADAGGRSAVG